MGLEQLIRVFIETPTLGSPSSLKVRDSSYESNATGYRPKFMLSYCFSLLTSCVPNATQVVESFARDYTCFGPAPTILFAELTGIQRENVSFARSLRRLLQDAYHIDLELYTIQYLPCMFHRAAPAALRAANGLGLAAFALVDSIARSRAKDHMLAECEMMIAKASFLQHSGVLAEMSALSIAQRARVFRELQLERAIAKPGAARTLVREIRKPPILDVVRASGLAQAGSCGRGSKTTLH